MSDLVKMVYNLLLGRDPEPAALRHWNSMLAGGMSEKEFIRNVLSSKECSEYFGVEPFNSLDVDFVIPLQSVMLRVPASDNSLTPHLLKDRCWEPHISNYLTNNLTRSDIFIDIGANLGYFVVLCAPLVKHVHAFEPVQKAYEYCGKNLKLNNLNNVTMYDVGVWSHHCDLEINVDETNLMSSYIGTGQKITCISLDELSLAPTIIKMDIEGAEPFALDGMKKTISLHQPKIILECNRPAMNRFGKDMINIYSFFDIYNYEISAFRHWKEESPQKVDYAKLEEICPCNGLIDLLATPI